MDAQRDGRGRKIHTCSPCTESMEMQMFSVNTHYCKIFRQIKHQQQQRQSSNSCYCCCCITISKSVNDTMISTSFHRIKMCISTNGCFKIFASFNTLQFESGTSTSSTSMHVAQLPSASALVKSKRDN